MTSRSYCHVVIGALVLIGSPATPQSANAQALPFNVVHTFAAIAPFHPSAALIQATDGNFYGTTNDGGDADLGTVFRMTPAGVVTLLHSFRGADGANPSNGSLLQAADGNLYGTTGSGGSSSLCVGCGTVFKMTLSGAVTVLHTFIGGDTDGARPYAGLTQAVDGNFYGTTFTGGSSDLGTLFRMTSDGEITVLHSFVGGNIDGAHPEAALVQAADGSFYGTTASGGSGELPSGTVFVMTSDGSTTILHRFSLSFDGADPMARLLQATDGNFYGTTSFGGPSSLAGGVFRMTPSGDVTVLHNFSGGTDGEDPIGHLIQATDGNLYGTNQSVVFKITLAGDLTVLHTFAGGADGASAYAGLTQAADGDLYGTTYAGGESNVGTVFRMTTGGIVNVLNAFKASPDGAAPYSAITKATDGNFYGTTFKGGPRDTGTAFKMTPAGGVRVVHAFTMGADGANPQGRLTQAGDGNFYGVSSRSTVFKMTPTGTVTVFHQFSFEGSGVSDLIQAADGNFYGTTMTGTCDSRGGCGAGVIFRMTLAGTVTLLHAFSGASDGASPYLGGLIQGTDGNLYGTTERGGGSANGGTVLKVSPIGMTTILHAFSGADGTAPRAALVQGTDGNFYGTTQSGGPGTGGTIFRISPSGAFTVLHQLDSATEGAAVYGALIQGRDGSFYGTASSGGAFNMGTVFKMTPSGSMTVLHTFTGGADGATPLAALYQGTDGSLYGTASAGGAGSGVIFATTSDDHLSPPTVTTGAASGTKTFQTMLNGTANPNGVATTALFQYGLTIAYGRATPAQDVGAGNSPVEIGGGAITSLACGRQYHFRATATNANGTSTGSDATFVTSPCEAADFDGDGKADVAVYRPSTGTWFVERSSTNNTTFVSTAWGTSTDIPVPGDYDGDGKADFAVYRPSTGVWFIEQSSTNYTTYVSVTWGVSTDIPVARDYDGDGRTDVAVYRPSTGVWFVLQSSTNNATFSSTAWGTMADIPVPGDYDGDGKADVAIYRPATGAWFALQSSSNNTTFVTTAWGTSTDLPVPGDYDGDGKTDVAIYRPSTGAWFLLQSSTNNSTFLSLPWGVGTDVPVPGDFDGDGKADVVVYRPATGAWLILQSSSGYTTFSMFTWGTSTDIPLPMRPS